MRILILDDDGALMARLTDGLIAPGRQVLCAGLPAMAAAWLRGQGADLLLLGPCAGRDVGALLQAFGSGLPPVIALSDADAAAAADLFARHPALCAILGRETEVGVLARIAAAAVEGRGTPGQLTAVPPAEAGASRSTPARDLARDLVHEPPRAAARDWLAPATAAGAPVARAIARPVEATGAGDSALALSRLLPQVAPLSQASPSRHPVAVAGRRLHLG